MLSFLWRRQWHPTPVLLPGKSHGWRSLEGWSPEGRWGLDTTEWLHFHFSTETFYELQIAEHWRIDAFELWYWRRLLKVPWTARRSNHSTLKEISPEYSLEGLMLKLKLQYFGHLEELTDWKRPWCLERLKVGEGEDRGWDGWMASLTQWTWVWTSFGSWWWTGRPGVLQSIGSQRVGHNWATELTDLENKWAVYVINYFCTKVLFQMSM